MTIKRLKGSGPGGRLAETGRALVIGIVSRLRGRHLLALDLIGITVAGYVALSMRFDAVLAKTSTYGLFCATSAEKPHVSAASERADWGRVPRSYR